MRRPADFFRYVLPVAGAVLGMAGLLLATPALSDTARAECGYSGSLEVRPAKTTGCMFSQRQGYITIAIGDDEPLDLRPTGDQPGNYRDAAGRAVYRRSGLGDAGQIFQTPDGFLYVYWWRERWECGAEQINAPGGCTIEYGTLSFGVSATSAGSLNTLELTTTGLESANLDETIEIDGSAYRAEIADLDANGWPEIYVYVSSAGSGSYGSLVAFAVNNGQSAARIYLRPLTSKDPAGQGYSGHDEFAVVEQRLVRRFPIYQPGDTNAEPSGGMRQLQYRLEQGEAGWLLELDKTVDY